MTRSDIQGLVKRLRVTEKKLEQSDRHRKTLERLRDKDQLLYENILADLVEARTSLERSNQELRTTQAQLVQQEKLASLGRLTSGIAHEINNPLNFVTNFAEIVIELADELGEAYEVDPEIKLEDLVDVLKDLRQNAGVIAQHGKRASGIIQAMMKHASSGSGQREQTNINRLVSQHIDLAFHAKQGQMQDINVEIELDLDEAVGIVEIVPQEIGRVILNLLSNAFDAVYERAHHVDGVYLPKVSVTTRLAGGEVEVRVSDNGPGIPLTIRNRIFEPFFTTKQTGLGTGLGLSLSYDIITQGHGGTLAVESEEGKGASFVVILPTI